MPDDTHDKGLTVQVLMTDSEPSPSPEELRLVRAHLGELFDALLRQIVTEEEKP